MDTMATTLSMGQDKSSDLVLSSLVRARFCELIALRVEHGQSDLFLMGMLSLIDAILAVPIGMVIKELSGFRRQGTTSFCEDGQKDTSFADLRADAGKRSGRLGTGYATRETT